jgi:hypothetical protein
MVTKQELLQGLGMLSTIGGVAAAPFTGGASLAVGAAGASVFGTLANMDAQDEMRKQLDDAASKNDKAKADELDFRQKLLEKISNEWTLPEFDTSKFTPEEIKYLGDYMPKVAEYIQEKRPELVTGLQAEREKNLQTQALSNLAQEAIGKPVQVQDMIRQKVELAQMRANQAEQARRASLLQDIANRGMLGTGQEALLMSKGQQESDYATRQAALQAGITGAQEQQSAQERENARKLTAMQALGSLSTTARQQQLGIEEQNVNAINAFNQRASATLQQHKNNEAAALNQAAMFNQQAKQNIATQNVAARNQAAEGGLDRANKLAELMANLKNRKLETEASVTGANIARAGEMAKDDYNQAVKRAEAGGGSAMGDLLTQAPQMAKSGVDLYKAVNTPAAAPTVNETLADVDTLEGSAMQKKYK